MIKRISDELLSSIKQPHSANKRIFLYDSLLNGFYVVLSVRSISFYLSHQNNGKRKSQKIGLYPITNTDTARAIALSILSGQQQPQPLPSQSQNTSSGESVKDALIRYANSRMSISIQI